MDHGLTRLLDAFAGLHVLVIGEAMLDSYLEGTSRRLCQEAPVPVVNLSARRDAPGGAANTAVNVCSLGARVSLLSVVGEDAEGERLRSALADRGIDAGHLLTHPARQTLAKHRLMAASQLLVRFDQGSIGPIDPKSERALTDRLAALWPGCAAVVVSDYAYGILAPRVIAALAELQADSPRVLVADSKDLGAFRAVGLTAAKPNYDEALRLLGAGDPGSPGARAEWMAAHGERILDCTGARIAAVTLDTEGALVFERDRPPYRTYAHPEHHTRAAGAGDTFLAALALALAAGAETPAAADLASAAAAVVVGKEGTASCAAQELRERLSTRGKAIADRVALAGLADRYRARGRRIVFTNGCFDILHRGHVAYLSQAKAQGDVLIVGLNSDASIRRLKGPTRPINAQEDRIQVLTALSCVDHIASFDEDTPHELIRAVRPDVFVKGGDYTRESLPEAPLVEELGGVVRLLPFVADRSTTDIIARIRAAFTATDGGRLVAAAPAGSLAAAASADGSSPRGCNGNGHVQGGRAGP